jgi:hypothetical protein
MQIITFEISDMTKLGAVAVPNLVAFALLKGE